MSTPWDIAKELLKEDICAGMVPPTMAPKDVYEMRVEYQEVMYENFRNNLNSLRKALDKLKNKADVDSAGIEHD